MLAAVVAGDPIHRKPPDSKGATMKSRHIWVSLMVAAYAGSFALPYYIEAAPWRVTGMHQFIIAPYFLIGFVLYLDGRFLHFASWLANPTSWAGVALLARGRWLGAALAGIIASLLASIDLYIHLAHSGVFALNVGYFAWLSSMILLAVIGLIGWRTCPPRGAAPPDRWTVPSAEAVSRIMGQREES
jgi:hypothetical protein